MDTTVVNRARPKPVAAMGWMVAAILVGSRHACLPAFAALGADAASVEADRASMKGQLRIAPAAGYTVHEIQTPANTVVREYVTPGGKVFAVSWRGPFLPDLRQTLGSYFAKYQEAASAPHGGHRHLSIEQPDLIVHSDGHMRAFYGLAYVPMLLPLNLSIDDIK